MTFDDYVDRILKGPMSLKLWFMMDHLLN